MRSFTQMNFALVVGLVALVAAGCAQQKNAMLEEAQAAYSAARSNPQVMNNAPLELNQAGEALMKAERLAEDDAESEAVTHQAYLAKQKTAIARQSAEFALAQQAIENADAQRKEVLLNARNRELQNVRQTSEERQKALETAQMKAQEREQQLQQQQAQMREEQLQQQLRQQSQKAEQLEQQLSQMRELNAKETERGIVLTLSDVLFDLDKAQLKPGAERILDKLARVLKENPDRTLLVEGFTDATGPDEYNQKLSEQRATSVRDALVSMGVGPDRIRTRGYGEQFPVASNDTPAGRQLNRRVEVVISNTDEAVSRK